MNTCLNVLNNNAFKHHNIAIRREKLTTLQINMGNLCNQSCLHCHIEASSQGENIMPEKVLDDILKFLSQYKLETLDITGGAPELNPHFDYLVREARALIKELIVRSNLTVFFERGKEYLPSFFKTNRVHLICSLPGYTKDKIDGQRGRGVFEKSIKALHILNALGFGRDHDLRLDLVHNPSGPDLPPPQDRLEKEYKRNLNDGYGITFNRLITIANVPIKRFKNYLDCRGEYENYRRFLENSFNVEVLNRLMCRSLLSVGWEGRLYDCDFNLALDFALKDKKGRILTLDTIAPGELEGREVNWGEHCFACAAGSGSSCQGALTSIPANKIRDEVKYFYQEAARQPKKELCCPVSYKEEDVSYIPKGVLSISYGCGSPISLAEVESGETVVDLGCGAGIDCFLAAKKAGLFGKIIGIDMTEEMINKANQAAEEVARNLGFLNCEFRYGFLEDVPVESESADLVTSNCVLNLSSDKAKVFAEIHRILKDGGRFVISDIVAEREPPVYMKNNRELWGECISGALTQGEFFAKTRAAGFYGLEILKNFKYREVEGIQFCSITVRGYKLKKGKECVYIGQYAIYRGPYSEIRDDDNHIFPRGMPIEICTDTALKLSKKPYLGQLIITETIKDGGPQPCCSGESPKGKSCC